MSTFPEAVRALDDGGVIAYPTEAVYGLGCDPLCESAVLHLLQLKQRSVDKGLILIAATVEQIMPYIMTLTAERMRQIYSTWPGPYTWVFPVSDQVPPWICGEHKSVAVRVTAHPVAHALCAAFGRPLVSSSANLQGQPPACDANTVKKIFPEGLAALIAGEVGGLAKPTQIRDAASGVLIR